MSDYMHRRKNGAVTGSAAFIMAAATLAAAVTALGAAKLTPQGKPAFLTENGAKTEITTRAETIDEFIKEQRARLHPFDTITHVGCGSDGTFEISVERAPHIVINVGGSERTVRAVIGETVGELLSRERIEVGEYDGVKPDAGSVINGNCTVTVTRAFPVTITADGQTKTVLAADMTVGELLVREGIGLGSTDEVNVGVDEPISEGMEIEVTRVEYVSRKRSEPIPFETENIDSPHLKIGDSEVITEGVPGSVSIDINEKFVNGELVYSEASDEKVTEAVNEVIAHGTALNTPYSKREGNYRLENGVPTEYAYMLNGKVTSYYAPEGVVGTYSGRPLVIGSVGVDPDVIPFGSELYIVSEDGSHVYGYAVASDTGNIKGTGIICDAYMGTSIEDCLWWQAQYCNVYVLTVGDNSVSWQ